MVGHFSKKKVFLIKRFKASKAFYAYGRISIFEIRKLSIKMYPQDHIPLILAS